MIGKLGIRRILASEEFLRLVTPKRENHLWITSTPKSGSTWIYEILHDVLSWQPLNLISTWERHEHELEPLLLLREAGHKNVISPNIHCKVNANTTAFFKRPEVATVVIVRNLPDSLVSLADHIDGKGSGDEKYFWPFVHVTEGEWSHLSRTEKIDFLVCHAAPWYINFHVGWQRYICSGTSDERIAFVRYEEFKQDPCSGIQRIMSSLKLPNLTENIIEAAITKAGRGFTRKNKAQVGRGGELSDDQMKHLYKLASFYPDIDFSSQLPNMQKDPHSNTRSN